jgi:type VI secretion system secreted protein VgrG
MGNYTQDNRLLRIKTPFPDNYLLINRLEATESISQLFEYEIELLHEEKEGWTVPEVIDPKKLLGQPVSVQANQLDGRGRFFSGIVNRFSQGSRGFTFTHYWITVVPKIWILTQQHQCRIFQQKTVPAILKEVFTGFENMIVWELDYGYKPRNYCVQYRESDFDFASRLMEEEGIYYYFEHSEDKHTLIVSDKPRFSRDCPGDPEVTYTYAATDGDFQSHILDWDTDYRLANGVVSFRDHHIQQPGKKLSVTSATKFEVGENGDWEIYDYPGGYARKFDGIGPGGDKTTADLDYIIPDGNRTAQTAMEVIDAEYMIGSGTSDVSSLTPGHKFKVVNHTISKCDGEYVVTYVKHTAPQNPTYQGNQEDGESYTNEFRSLAHGRPGAVPFRPPRKTEKPLVYGAQTATVVGTPGEEIYTDEFGRIKVQFNWDREGQTDGSDSCWVYVAQAWAGNGWGSMFIPRVGMEVLVHFLEGDPDQPMVTGCVYHPMNKPPYPLPEEKTKSTIKTYSTKGGDGFNEFRFEDKKGSEQIFIHGEKDLDIRIKNDRREFTGNDQHLIVKKVLREMIEDDSHLTVKGNHFEAISKDRHLKVSGKEAVEITGSKSLKVSSDVNTSISGNKAEEVAGSIYLKGMNIVIEAMTQLSLKVGGNFIDINPGGVFIKGTMVMINSGGAAGSGQSPSPVPPTAPSEPDPADDAKPGTKTTLEKQSVERKKKKPKEKDEPTSWIDLKMVDEEGNPVPGQGYEVTEADGTVHEGTLDHKGKAHVLLLKPGSCKVSFPGLDKGAWEEA